MFKYIVEREAKKFPLLSTPLLTINKNTQDFLLATKNME